MIAVIPKVTMNRLGITYDDAIPQALYDQITKATGDNPFGHIVYAYPAGKDACQGLLPVTPIGSAMLQAFYEHRGKDAEPKPSAAKWLTGSNMPGYMPEAVPEEFDDVGDAHESIHKMLNDLAEGMDNDDDADKLMEISAALDQIRNRPGEEFSIYVLGRCYWVSLVDLPE